ncbi:unnamed protein product [Protopolystoma xenopodis]|uniref:Transient receptor ion channel domain-containing protein n=1 Tax=Protopolystoma xenopodis TaxID=117903 RepID=A0A448XPA0_9PLAT|nr:unnamed protein product [Protopolystoma xenopodis]
MLGRTISSTFTPDITPIILAAHRDNYAIIKLLLDRGDRIARPHDLQCACNLCVQASREDSLQHSKLRINAYRALSSPSLIALSSKDPILTAFELSCELRRLGRLENEFRDDYEELSEKCQLFATSLLEQTRGSAELAIVLNHEIFSYGAGANVNMMKTSIMDETSTERMRLSRLKLAIKCKQKKVPK